MNDLTWEELVALEPRLNDLEADILAVKDPGPPERKSFCANLVWYQQFKPRLLRLVGYARDERDDAEENELPVLFSSEAYSLAYEHLYEPLPPCRNCGCLDTQLLRDMLQADNN